MAERRYRVLAVAAHPVQYMAPIFRRMAAHPGFDLHVAYCSLRGAEAGHDPEFGGRGQCAAPLRGAPTASTTAVLVGTDTNTLSPRDGRKWKTTVKKLLWPRLFRLADQVIVPSSGARDLMLSLGLPAERVTLTPYSVDNDWWMGQSARVDRAAVRAGWGVADIDAVILFCAKLQPWKRPGDLLRAFAEAKLANTVLVIAGEGPLRAE